MKQAGFTKIVAVIIVCVLLVGGYYITSRSVQHVVTAHRASVARQAAIAKAAQAKELETKLEAAWQQVLSGSPADGNVDIAVYDSKTGATAHYTNAAAGTTYNTASVIKLSILEDLLWHDQKQGLAGLTSSQLAEAVPMIENSDNDAATSLWQLDGGQSALATFFHRIGALHTTTGVHWGLTQTTALDQLKVVNEVAYPGNLLSAGSAVQANDLMDHVETDQQWGVSAGVPSGVTVQLKNGWLDDNTGWDVNSIGHVHGDGVDYTIAVLTDNNNSEQDGINTVQALSSATWGVVTQ